MPIGSNRRHSAFETLFCTGLAALGMTLVLGACTTAEGTNALTDFRTFEREVMTSTVRGVGLVPGEARKADLTAARAPLVLPGSAQTLPPPAQASSAQLPVNSDTVRIDTSNLTEADMQRLRNARIVDMQTLSGRPLTEAEARQLTARMRAANVQVTENTRRPLYLPPENYFTRVGDAQLVCSTSTGEVVSLNDPRCPETVRKAIRAAQTPVLNKANTISTTTGAGFTRGETSLR